MSQHDFDIANQGFAAFRTDLNNALKALASLSSGTAEPATTYANQLWYETDTNTLQLRNEANSAWLNVMVIDQTTGSPSFTAGNVGIGNSNPTARLEVVTSSGTATAKIWSATNTTPIADLELQRGTNATWGADAYGDYRLRNDSGALLFQYGESTVTTERLRIDASGNVGIGTSSPASIVGGTDTNPVLSVGGVDASLAVGDKAGSLSFITNDGSYTVTYADGVTSEIASVSESGTGAAYGLAFYTGTITGSNRGERVRITREGNVGIGESSPITPLHVAGASITTGVSYKAQALPTSKAAAATLTIAELLTGIIQYTGAVATLTLPTGTLIEGGLPATFPSGVSFDVSFINTGAALLTIGTATGLTLTGTMTVATGTSGILRFRKSAANNYNVYRVA